MRKGRKKSQLLTFIFEMVLIASIFSASSLAWADESSPPSSPPPPPKIYKGEVETNTTVEPQKQPSYAGTVITSENFPTMPEDKTPEPPSGRKLNQGFYMGGFGGYENYQMLSKVNLTEDGVSVLQQNPELNASGFSYTGVGGFGWVFDEPMYLGAELFYSYNRADTIQTINFDVDGVTGSYSLQPEVQASYGASFMPGIKMGDATLFYLKAGYTWTQVKTYETAAAAGINNAQTNGVSGIHYGLGFEVEVYGDLSMRAEYIHTTCKSFSTQVGTRITPTGNQYMLGLIVHFV